MVSSKLYDKFKKNIEFYTSEVCKMTPTEFNKFSRKTQQEMVLWHLMQYGSITNLQANGIYSIRHLPSAIRRLKKQGYNIDSNDKTGQTMFGRKVHYVQYVLISDRLPHFVYITRSVEGYDRIEQRQVKYILARESITFGSGKVYKVVYFAAEELPEFDKYPMARYIGNPNVSYTDVVTAENAVIEELKKIGYEL